MNQERKYKVIAAIDDALLVFITIFTLYFFNIPADWTSAIIFGLTFLVLGISLACWRTRNNE